MAGNNLIAFRVDEENCRGHLGWTLRTYLLNETRKRENSPAPLMSLYKRNKNDETHDAAKTNKQSENEQRRREEDKR